MSERDILAVIDGALADYAVSSDAMRWVPEDKRPERRHPPRFQNSALIRQPMTPEEAAEAARVFGEAIRAGMERWAEACREIARVFDRLGQSLREAGVLPETPAADPRARALEAVRHRNTGPDRDVVHQRRSRRVP